VTAPADIRSQAVLIIDDSPEDQIAYRYHLEPVYRVTGVNSGTAGLAAWRDSRPDCVLLDYRLPDMDGIEVLDALEEAGALLECPVVLLTGNADTDTAVAALKHGATDFLDKSRAEPTSLRRTIANAIDKAALERELRLHRAGLEKLVAERTAELEKANSLLAAAKEAAEASNRAKSAFLATMSH
jgi:DNA-binding NtrC family response regulator